MAARLAPYLRYYSSRRPLNDHDALPVVLMIFNDDLAVTHFLQVARQAMNRAGVEIPCGYPTRRRWNGWGRWDGLGRLLGGNRTMRLRSRAVLTAQGMNYGLWETDLPSFLLGME